MGRLLSINGANIDYADDYGYTPLHLASDSANTVLLLPEKGANMHGRTQWGLTPLHTACRSCCVFLKVLNIHVPRILLEWGADVDSQDDVGNTPLHLATEYETEVGTDMVVLEKGAILESKKKWRDSCGPCQRKK